MMRRLRVLAPSESDTLKDEYSTEGSWTMRNNPGRDPRCRPSRLWDPNTRYPGELQSTGIPGDLPARDRAEPAGDPADGRQLAAPLDLPPRLRPKPDLNPALNFDIYQLGPEASRRMLASSRPRHWAGGWIPRTMPRCCSTCSNSTACEPSRPRTTESSGPAGERTLPSGAGDRSTPTPEDLVGPYLKTLPAEFLPGHERQGNRSACDAVEMKRAVLHLPLDTSRRDREAFVTAVSDGVSSSV